VKKTDAGKGYVVGSGPNGLTAAILLARAGFKTTLFEAESQIGGGLRSAELTLPGFVHDVCSAVHPLAVTSPVFASFPLAEHGLEWIHPTAPLAHTLGNRAVLMQRSIDSTASLLGADGAAYQCIVTRLVADWKPLTAEILAPLHFPAHPLIVARFGRLAIRSAIHAAQSRFRLPETRALFAGVAAHSILPLDQPGSAAFGWMLTGAAHAVGWPIPRGGSQSIANALGSYFQSLGGEIVTNTRIDSMNDLPRDGPILCDVGPRQLLRMAGSELPRAYARKLESYRYGPGVFKMDFALSGPIPWKANECRLAGTVHIGGTLEEVVAAERAPWANNTAARPFVLLAQPSLFDSTRAPVGRHTAWAYCHVPNGSTENMAERIETEIERVAPGFRATILARHARTTTDMETHNANLVGGDISGGVMDLRQLFFRPTRSLYRTPIRRVYLCSASTPPGAGVHGMCGYHAAKMALCVEGRGLH
jgi:phytoene dehydrogenase-like protein